MLLFKFYNTIYVIIVTFISVFAICDEETGKWHVWVRRFLHGFVKWVSKQAKLYVNLYILFIIFDWVCNSYMVTLQLYCCGGIPLYFITGTNRYLSITTDESSLWWDSNPQRWVSSGLKSTNLTTRPRTPRFSINY